ncbi:MAG: DUF6789 family protein [Gemmatimonadaceae bacterium]
MDTKRAAAAGTIATAAMTALLLVEPSIGLPKIAIGEILSSTMSAISSRTAVGPSVGWLVDLAVGIVFALIYAGYLDRRLPGTSIGRGLLFGFIVFIVAQLVFAPLTGSGVFSGGDIVLLAGGLLGHLVYGVVVGYIYGDAGKHPVSGGA